MPAYRIMVAVEYTAKRDDSSDRAAAIVSAIEEIPFIRVSWNEDAEQIDTPTQPDEDGQ